MASDLHLDLLENGIDFIRVGIEEFFAPGADDPRRHKYALLHIFSGTLLLLKERLRREHRALIWKEVVRVDDETAKTVDFDEAIERVQKVCKVGLAAKDMDLLRWCQKKRNQLEHYHCVLNLPETQTRIASLVEFVDGFLSTQLGVELGKKLSPSVWREISELKQIAARIEEQRLAEWRARAAKYQHLNDEELEKLVDVEPYHPKDNPHPVEAGECPYCSEEALFAVEPDIEVCTNLECREVVRLTACERCGSMSTRTFCATCQADFAHYMDRD